MQCGNMLISQMHAMQDEALRPFVAVLRHAENALVREMTVQVVSQAIATNPKGLGSGALFLHWPGTTFQPQIDDVSSRSVCGLPEG